MLFKNINADEIKWGESGLIPGIVQDFYTGRVLMLAYVNRESLAFMQEKGETCFWSRSRNELWHKGATSGDVQKIMCMALDCDNDTLLIQAEQMGKGACHTGSYSCFGDEEESAFYSFEYDYETIKNRAVNPQPDSYTNYLMKKGLDKICKKIGEEATEVVIAAKNKDTAELTAEIADLSYHILVLMHECGVTPREITEEIVKRNRSLQKKHKPKG
ncbi:MAG: bifunctional phosphoribosyl-AMP cyclohydrolase/phosphoribosyl-ATP diphosphatase HisIE [Defluviitaleaceae bacterium]|nr:bifunctional phosphoribosyl-AMP cyclohydrolase/phosphoribosyl-ATP diphosphatase HisIE [Defluviitaleaceae bacterium]MCL2262631.1 bifunctional phosphoribosyl-AMP cyclohydrolase/phosphoribosyl-ATP diphosphatase HisIE [Defluviitaleaceae bacterium]